MYLFGRPKKRGEKQKKQEKQKHVKHVKRVVAPWTKKEATYQFSSPDSPGAMDYSAQKAGLAVLNLRPPTQSVKGYQPMVNLGCI